MLLEQDFKTRGFNVTEVKAHFINPICFGEDVVSALRALAAPAAPELEFGEPIQEDYGWGFWIGAPKDAYWVAVALIEPETETWRLLANRDPGFNLWRRFFARPDAAAAERIRQVLPQALTRLPGGALI